MDFKQFSATGYWIKGFFFPSALFCLINQKKVSAILVAQQPETASKQAKMVLFQAWESII